MKNRIFIFLAILVYASQVSQSKEYPKPNIVMFYIDDWAWNGTPVRMDSSMDNSRIPVLQMPNVEKLAREGMKFRNAYGSPQCSPARASVQTGQSNPRNGLTVYMSSKENYYDYKSEYKHFPLIANVADSQLREDALTIAEALEPLGYVSGHIGKWHMRGDPGKEGYVMHDGDTNNNPGNTLRATLNKGEPIPRRLPKDMSDPKLMFSITAKAMRFIEEQADNKNPFYLQISHYAMHSGRECLEATRQKYVKHPKVQQWYKANNKDPKTINRKDDPAIWFGMGEDLDGRIGAVINKIKDLGLEDNTYFVVVADNGYRHKELHLEPELKQPLHARKWWLWDGGIRVPMIVKGPGIKPGSEFMGNVINYDFLPTFVDWAGGDSKALKNIDGVSLVKYMEGAQPDQAFLNRYLYFHYPHYRSAIPHSAVVTGKYKVIHFYDQPDIPMLFDTSVDLGEVENIAAMFPDEHKKILGSMMDYLNHVGARIPKSNPNFNASIYKADKNSYDRLRWGAFKGSRKLEDDEK